MTTELRPFTLKIDQSELDELQRRLANTRWPEPETGPPWAQGVPIDRLRRLVNYWRTDYDWRRCEAMLNGFGQYKSLIDGIDVHFLHVRSSHPDALPLLLTHGWPGSVIEFHKVIGALSDPVAHGGSAADAFDIVVPSLPGYGFSSKPAQSGCGVETIARMWAELMKRLGYNRYVAQGGDWGAAVTVSLGVQAPPGLIGVHLNMITVMPPDLGDDIDEDEKSAAAKAKQFADVESAYARLQATRPQTLGYLLADSPVGQAAWIYEKLRTWSDCNGEVENILTDDEILDNIMLYWLTNSGASSARIYWESMGSFRPQNIAMPLGYSQFPAEIMTPPRKWADKMFSNIIHWRDVDKGGHFAAFEQPELFVDEIRTCFRQLR